MNANGLAKHSADLKRKIMIKDKDFDKVIEIMKDKFQWKGEVGKDNFTYTNELIKATKLALGLGIVSNNEVVVCDNPNCEDGIVDYDYYKHPIYCQVCEQTDC